MRKTGGEKFKTFGDVFDNFTLANLVSLAQKGCFMEGTLSTGKIGKEANVFFAENEQGERVCLKIYRLETANFNRMYEYIRSDPRFVGVLHKRRKVIFAWVQREFRNLMIAADAKVSAPKPIKFQSNVLVMSYIGGRQEPAPMLKDAPPRNPQGFFEKTLENMRTLYARGYTHGDLSRFNILNHRERPVLIDFSHSTLNTNPIFQELLERDAKNIALDFWQYGVKTSKEEILKYIRG